MSGLESTDWSSGSERSSSESDDSDSDPPDYDHKAGRHDYDKTESEDKGYHDSPAAGRSEQGDSDQSNDSASDTNTEDHSMEETIDDSSNISTAVNSREKSEKEKKPQYKTRTLHYYWKSQKPQTHGQPIEVTPSKDLKKIRKQPGVSEVFSKEEFSSVTLKENNPAAANVNGNRRQSDSGDSQAIKQLIKRELQVEQQGHVLLDKSQSPIGISASSSTKANAQPAAAVSSAQSSRKRRKKRTGEREVVETRQEDEAGLKRSRQYKNDEVYNRVFLKLDKIIHFLVANVSPGELANKLLVADLITEHVREKALVTSVPGSENFRPMIDSVLSRIELNGAIYDKFIGVLRQFKSLDDLIQFIERPEQ